MKHTLIEIIYIHNQYSNVFVKGNIEYINSVKIIQFSTPQHVYFSNLFHQVNWFKFIIVLYRLEYNSTLVFEKMYKTRISDYSSNYI